MLEIDGASNRGIDEIRSLRENVKFAPAAAPFKIYIIDEVHQITTDGFNALLKTLEEPPAHVKFIFATTSAQKVPATILSRCQRFDFRRIPTETIVTALKEICKKEKIRIDEEALFLIAKAADGSLRDSQSILDQIAATAAAKEGMVRSPDVLASIGAVPEETLLELTRAIGAHDAAAALGALHGALDAGKDAAVFAERLLEHVRNLLFCKVSEDLVRLIDASDTHRKAVAAQARGLTQPDLFYFFSVIQQTIFTMKRFELKRIPLEIAVIKMAQAAPLADLAQIMESLKRPPVREKKTDKIERAEEAGEPDVEELPSGELEVPDSIRGKETPVFGQIWNALIAAVKSERISLASYLSEGEPLDLKNGIARISFPESHAFHRETLEHPDNRKLIERHLAVLLGGPARVEFESVPQLRRPAQGESGAQPPAGPENGVIKSAMNLFGGRMI